jgi:pyridinium-3,5-biscarboxylic acid mononucleotide sulfurtransferase
MDRQTNSMQDNSQDKIGQLVGLLRSYQKVCVAFSAGVDSSFLLDIASKTLPGNVIAMMAIGSMVPERDLAEAKEFCESRSIPLKQFEAGELDVPQFLYNEPDRCYHCKKNIFTQIQQLAAAEGYKVVVEGSNADDIGDYRPGMRALSELGILSPMLMVGLTKAEIRSVAKQNGVSTWNKPAGACLATRVPFGETISKTLLKTIEEAEYQLADAGIPGGRVRVHGAVARLEIPWTLLDVFMTKRLEMVEAMKKLGFRHVCLDLEGYVKGSMNRALEEGTDNGHD